MLARSATSGEALVIKSRAPWGRVRLPSAVALDLGDALASFTGGAAATLHCRSFGGADLDKCASMSLPEGNPKVERVAGKPLCRPRRLTEDHGPILREERLLVALRPQRP